MKKKLISVMAIIVVIIVGIGYGYSYNQKYRQWRNIVTGEKYSVTLDKKEPSGYIPADIELKPVPDILEIDARIIDKNLGNSFKVGKYDLYDEIKENHFSLWKFYSADNPDKINMSVIAGKPEYFENVITKIHPDTPVQAIDIIKDPEVSGEYAPYMLAYRIKNSHNAYINISHPEKDIAVIEDINNNFILIEIYDKNSHLDIFNIVANFECFEADGYRFINSEYRDGIYVDDIVKVTERK